MVSQIYISKKKKFCGSNGQFKIHLTEFCKISILRDSLFKKNQITKYEILQKLYWPPYSPSAETWLVRQTKLTASQKKTFCPKKMNFGTAHHQTHDYWQKEKEKKEEVRVSKNNKKDAIFNVTLPVRLRQT
jgi:hypothetical protein